MTLGSSVVIGQICAPYGVKGWVHVRSFTDPASNLENFSSWQLYFKDKKHSKLVQVEQFKVHNDHFVAKLVDIEDRDMAASITNWQITTSRDSLPQLAGGEYYLADLLGLTVSNTVGDVTLGIVTDFLETGAHEILVVKGEKEHLIPCVFGEHILNVCLEKKEIQVAWDAEF